MSQFEFRIAPFPHQLQEWEAHRESLGRAILWEQGTGKSKEIVDQASWCYMRGLIDAVVVVAPNGVHRNWVEEEIPTHMPESLVDSVRAMYFQSEKSGTKWHKQACLDVIRHPGFAWFTISYEAFVTVAGKQALITMFDKRRVFYVLDEAHYINNPDAGRTQSILMSSKYAVVKRALTGTPISTGPFNVYSLVNFIDPTYWERQGFSTFVEFRSHFAVFEKGWDPSGWTFDPVTKTRKPGREFEKLKEYRRLDELNRLLQPLSSRVTKESAGLKLPPKRYVKEFFTMSDEQAAMYLQMKKEYMVWLGTPEAEADEEVGKNLAFCFSCNGTREVEMEGYIYACPECSTNAVELPRDGTVVVVATMAMTRLLRLQQITCGYLPTDDDDEPVYTLPGPNRRLDRLKQIVADRVALGKKVIVWARFQLDISLILDAMKSLGIRAVRYDGQVDDDGRAEAKALFKGERPLMNKGVLIGREKIPREEQADVFVGNPSAGATGLTLNIAKVSIYYSNSFKLIDRLQSEDRNHRIGQDEEVEYIDILAERTVDERIVSNLREKHGIAGQILGDEVKEWL